MPEMRSKPQKRNEPASGETQGVGDAAASLQTAMSRQLDDVRRQLEESAQQMARQSVEMDRLQKLLAELHASVNHLETEAAAKRRAAATPPESVSEQSVVVTDEPPQHLPRDLGQVEMRLSALMGLPIVLSKPLAASAAAASRAAGLGDLPRPDVNSVEHRLRVVMGLKVKTQTPASVSVFSAADTAIGDRFDREATETKKGSLALAATKRLPNRRRGRFPQSPVLHMTIGGLIAGCAGMAMQWTPLTKPVVRQPETPATAVLAALTAKVARLEARQATPPPSPATPVQKVPPPSLSAPSPSSPIRIAGVTIRPLVLRLTDDVRIPAPAPALAISSSTGEGGTKPSLPVKGLKPETKALPPPVPAAAVKAEPVKEAVSKAVASVPPTQSGPPVNPPKKTRPKPKAKEPSKPVAESELVLINGGTVVVGDGIDGLRDALPHRVILSPYMIGRHEVTLELWEKVRTWGRDHGYDLPVGMGKDARHPVYAVVWADAAKWCNARSEMEKLTPCYYQDGGLTAVFRSGEADLTNRCVKWDANGYRLPTEAEWEVAARGRLEGRRFPWGDEITHQDANYSSKASAAYDKSRQRGTPPAYSGQLPHTAPAGSFKSNGFGLYDMAGNVAEWCWDSYDKHYGIVGLDTATSGAASLALPAIRDPRGPDSGNTSVVRGGSWRHDAPDARCASRFDLPVSVPSPHVGFRVARRS